MENKNSDDHLSFNQNKRKPFLFRLAPRVLIYPIVILLVVMFMNKRKEMARKSAEEQQPGEQMLVRLDPMKPAAITPANVPVFPQLVFYYDGQLENREMVNALHEKYHKVCTVIALDITGNPRLKEQYAEQKPPFAVLSKPDGTTLTIQSSMKQEFYETMLDNLDKPDGTPVPQTATAPETSAPAAN